MHDSVCTFDLRGPDASRMSQLLQLAKDLKKMRPEQTLHVVVVPAHAEAAIPLIAQSPCECVLVTCLGMRLDHVALLFDGCKAKFVLVNRLDRSEDPGKIDGMIRRQKNACFFQKSFQLSMVKGDLCKEKTADVLAALSNLAYFQGQGVEKIRLLIGHPILNA